MPVPVWFRLCTDPGYAESYVDFYPRFLRVRLEWTEFPFVVQDAPPDGLFETGQLWFVVLLLAWSLLPLPAREPLYRGQEPPALDQAGEAVLPVHVVHQPVLVAVAFVVVGWALPGPVKYLVIVLATLLAVTAAYLLVRRTRPTRFLFGMRPAARRSSGPAGRRPDGG